MNKNQTDRPVLRMKNTTSTPAGGAARFSYGKKTSGGARALMHDKDLKRFEQEQCPLVIYLMSGNTLERVTVVGSDKYTIKVKLQSGLVATYFKHAVASFSELNQSLN